MVGSQTLALITCVRFAPLQYIFILAQRGFFFVVASFAPEGGKEGAA
jgi:hypothetical protein